MAKKKPPLAEPAAGPADYTVLARRYRPQQFGDLIGQESVAQALVNALKSNRVAHAYLFTGTRGVGKTSAARILAKALNCVNGPTPTPCDQCETCRAIAAGQDDDVSEIDGASNRGIDDIRELRQNVQYRPIRSRFKIYIIDEVHQLSKDAFNALLKTLEEPPGHVKFIFASTEVTKIPITILSRCQRFDFKNISGKRIQERLQKILDEEGVTAEPGVLDILARRASGSMRDAQSLLDQIVAFGGPKLTLDVVNQLLGTADEEQVAKLAAAMLQHDVPQALQLLGETIEAGTQLGELLDQLLDYWRDLLILNSAGAEVEGLSFSPRLRELMQKQAQVLPLDTILAGLDILAATKSRLRGTSHGRVLLEMVVVRLARLEELLPLSELVRQLANGAPAATRLPQPRSATASSPSVPSEVVKKKLGGDGIPAAPVSTQSPPATPISLTAVTLEPIWRQTLATLGQIHRLDLQKAGLPAISAPNCLVLRFSSDYNSEREHCEESARNNQLEAALAKITGTKVAVRYEAAAHAPAASPPSPRLPRNEQIRRSALQEPLVKAVVEQLGGNLVRIDEGFGALPAASTTDSEESD